MRLYLNREIQIASGSAHRPAFPLPARVRARHLPRRRECARQSSRVPHSPFAAARLARCAQFARSAAARARHIERILPAACWIVPLPLHVGQTCGVPTAPVPWHVWRNPSRDLNFFTAPRTASQNQSRFGIRGPPRLPLPLALHFHRVRQIRS